MRKALFILLLLAAVAPAQEAPERDAPAKEAPKKKEEVARIAEIRLKVLGTEDPHPPMPFGATPMNYYGFLRFVRKAARDPDLDAVILKPNYYGVGWARLLEVRDALAELRKSGKKVFLYNESLSTPDLVLASVADRISVPESGSVVIPGLAIESLYMKGLMDKLRIRFDVIHIGEYKTAGESLVRDTMSPELKESLDPILDEYYESMVQAIAEGRGIPVANVKQAVDRGILTAKEAKQLGLIDRVEYYDEFKEGIKAYFPDRKVKRAHDYEEKKNKLDTSNPMAFFGVLMQALSGAKEPEPKGPKVAIIYCTGAITSGKSQYDWQGNIASMGSETIVKAIDKVADDDDVKAIVLRVNSPGGSALASDMIWHAVERAKKKKPVVTSMGDLAASGGYYIAMNSSTIVAEPQTITGSIGVVGLIPNLSGFMQWIGINPQRLTRGKRAAGFMTMRGLDDDDKRILREHMEAIYGDFVAKVAAGRGKAPAEIHKIARGRIWTGRDAQRLGLVDKLGGLRDAVALAREKGGIAADLEEGEGFHVVEYPRRAGPFEFLEEMFGARLGLDAVALREMPLLRRALVWLRVLEQVGADRVALVHPELTGLAHPFGAPDR